MRKEKAKKFYKKQIPKDRSHSENQNDIDLRDKKKRRKNEKIKKRSRIINRKKK